MKTLSLSLRLTLATLAVALLGSCVGGALSPFALGRDIERMDKARLESDKQTAQCRKLGKAEVALQEEQVLGDAAAIYWLQETKLLVDKTGREEAAQPTRTPRNDALVHLNVIGRNLALQSSRPTLPWAFGIFDSEAVNAVALPGGKIFVTRGLLKLVTNEAQLAGVLAHEIAHVTRKHGLAAYQQVKVDQCIAAATGRLAQSVMSTSFASALRASFGRSLASATVGFLDLDDVMNVDMLAGLVEDFGKALKDKGYSHAAEFEADREGLELTIRAGYNPAEYLKLIKKLPATGLFSHHPANQDRIARMDKQLAALRNPPPEDDFREVPHDFDGYPAVELSPKLTALR